MCLRSRLPLRVRSRRPPKSFLYTAPGTGPARARSANVREDPAWLVQMATEVEAVAHGLLTESHVDQLVDFDQMAAIAGLSKRKVRRLFDDGDLPDPDRIGTGGNAHLWFWSRLRPALEPHARRALPRIFPGSLALS